MFVVVSIMWNSNVETWFELHERHKEGIAQRVGVCMWLYCLFSTYWVSTKDTYIVHGKLYKGFTQMWEDCVCGSSQSWKNGTRENAFSMNVKTVG